MSDVHGDRESPRFCDYEGSDYRTAFWEGKRREYEDLAERHAITRLLPSTGERIVDIGGGFGRLLDLYEGYHQVVLMDYSMTQLRDAQRLHGSERVLCVAANLYEAPFVTSAFDAAVMVRVIHHLSDVGAAFEAISDMLRPQGGLILEYANKRNIKAILRYLLGRQAHNPFSYQPWEFAELNFDYHPSYIEQHLHNAKLYPKRQLSVSHFRIGCLKRCVSPSVLAAIDGWLQQPAAPLKLTPSMFVQAVSLRAGTVKVSDRLFRCPRCGAEELIERSDRLICRQCQARWGIVDGIYDFREPLPEA